jgi:hypothetical protein
VSIDARAQRLRLYRLWRTASLLCALGTVEIAVMAWQNQRPLIALTCLPLAFVSAYGARRAGILRRAL